MSRMRILLLIPLLVVLVGAVFLWHQLSGRESTDDARIDGHIYPVSAQIPGTIESVELEENQWVEVDAILARIDDRRYRTAVAKAEADLARARAYYREAQAQLPVVSVEADTRVSSSEAALRSAHSAVESALKDRDVARARLETAQAGVVEAEVNHRKATRDLERMKPLITKDEISQQQFDGFVAAADAAAAVKASAQAAVSEALSLVALAEARIGEARAAVTIAESNVEAASTAPHDVAASRARISAAHALVDQAEAALEQARLDFEHTIVRAPVSGIVSKKNVEPGTVVQPGQPLLAVVPLEGVWVTANFKETQLEAIRVGQTAEVQVDTYADKAFRAQVDSVAPATGATFSLLPPENASGNFVKVVQRIPVKLVLTEPLERERPLRPGMSVVVTVFTSPVGP